MSERTLTALIGRAGSGRSEWLFDRIRGHVEHDEPAILITEKQSSYEAEKALAAAGGLIGAEVLSLTRLQERLLEENGETPAYLSEEGRRMVIRKMSEKNKDKLRLFGGLVSRRGFAGEADTLLSRLVSSGTDPDTLAKTVSTLPDGTLKDKLSDISVLYSAVEEFLSGKYLTEFSLTERAIACLPASELIKSHIYVDSADVSGGHAFRFLSEATKYCRSLTVTVLADPVRENEELFAPGRKLYEKLFTLASDAGLSFREQRMDRAADAAPALRHLEGYLYRERVMPYAGDPEGFSFTVCASPETEAELLGEEILKLTRAEDGALYRDIAVTVTDPVRYLPLIRRAFNRRGIPLFDDSPRPLSAQAASDLMLSAVRFAARGSMEDVLHIIKSGLAGVSVDECEEFENYVLRYGLFGSAVFSPFTFHEKDKPVPPAAESARAKIAAPLRKLKEDLSREHAAAKDRVTAVFSFLSGLNVREQLYEKACALTEQGEVSESRVLMEIWNRLMELLGQIHRLLGEDRMTLKELRDLLEEGVNSVQLSALPGRQDCVSVGDTDRTRVPQRSVMFVLGANEGKFPPVRTDDGLLSDSELRLLESEHGLSLWENTEGLMAADRLDVYTLLSKAKKKLYLFSSAGDGGSELSVTPLLQHLKELFPALRERQQLASPFPYYPEGAFRRTVEELVRFEREGVLPESDENGAGLPERLAFFRENEPYRSRLAEIEAFRSLNPKELSLGEERAKKLFAPKMRRISASELETYNKCPFEHYMKYGLGLEERKELKEEASDAGTFLHDALEKFVKLVMERGLSYETMTEMESDALIEEIVDELKKTHHDGIYETNPLMASSLFLTAATLKRCARAIVNQSRLGSFRPAEAEYSFGYEDSKNAALRLPGTAGADLLGRIDRIDRTEDGKYVRIVDYKMTAAKTFQPGALKAGTTLQLPLYLGAVLSKDGASVPAGMYYMPLNQTPGKEEEPTPTMLRGVTASEQDVLNATEKDMGDKSSLIASLKKNKNGSFSAHAIICEADRLGEIVNFTAQKAGRTAECILSGGAPAAPREGACTWCKFSDVCRFGLNEDDKEKKLPKMKIGQLLNEIEEGTVWDE